MRGGGAEGQSGSAERQHTIGIRREGQRLLVWRLRSCGRARPGASEFVFWQNVNKPGGGPPLCALSYSHVLSGNQGVIPELLSTWLNYQRSSRIVILNDWESSKLKRQKTGQDGSRVCSLIGILLLKQMIELFEAA